MDKAKRTKTATAADGAFHRIAGPTTVCLQGE